MKRIERKEEESHMMIFCWMKWKREEQAKIERENENENVQISPTSKTKRGEICDKIKYKKTESKNNRAGLVVRKPLAIQK